MCSCTRKTYDSTAVAIKLMTVRTLKATGRSCTRKSALVSS